MVTVARESASVGEALGPGNGYVHACRLEDLQREGMLTTGGTGQNIALFWHEGNVYAVDNRCPHMGFPLSKGSCKEGILTCYWHYARFDLQSGGCFDPGLADDVQTYPVLVRDGDVWVDTSVAADTPERRETQRRRLRRMSCCAITSATQTRVLSSRLSERNAMIPCVKSESSVP